MKLDTFWEPDKPPKSELSVPLRLLRFLLGVGLITLLCAGLAGWASC